MDALRFVFNVLWVTLGGGLIAWFLWSLAGALLAITIVGLPWSRACFTIAHYALWPYGRDIVTQAELEGDGAQPVEGTWNTALNLVWIVLAGVWLFIAHVAGGIALCLTIIGIPFGLAHFKIAAVALWPVNRRIVDDETAAALRLGRARSALP